MISLRPQSVVRNFFLETTFPPEPLVQISYNFTQGWVENSTPGIYRWNLPVFPGMANKAQVANNGNYYIPINNMPFELSVFLPADPESRINELRFSESISLSFKTRLGLLSNSTGNTPVYF